MLVLSHTIFTVYVWKLRTTYSILFGIFDHLTDLCEYETDILTVISRVLIVFAAVQSESFCLTYLILSDKLHLVFQKLGMYSRREKRSVGLLLSAFFHVISSLSEQKSGVFCFLTLSNTLALSDNRIDMVRKCVYTYIS